MSFRSVLFPLVLCSLLLLVVELKAQQQATVPVLELRLAEMEPGDGLTKLDVDGGEPIYLHSESIIRENDIQTVEAKEQPRRSGKAIYIMLTNAGGKKLGAASEANLKKPMAILYNGSLVAAPLIQSKLDRNVVINGDFSETQIDEMLEALQPRPHVASFDETDLEKFSARMDKALENRIFSGTVLIAVGGKIVFEKSVGFANIDDESPFTQRSSFRLASVSKQFTAMGIMLLKEQGKLEFDDDITKHLPTLPYKGITIRHLLHHTGGLPDYMDLFSKHWDIDVAEASKKTAFNKDLVDLFSRRKPKPIFEPGKRYQYSNTGYVLLGSVIEAASGQTIHEFFKTQIFEPLEMKDSSAFSIDENEFKPKSRVFGFAWQGDEHVANDWNYLNGMVGDGGIYCSARDLLKWDQALYGEKLVSQTTLDEAFTSGKLDSGMETGYGFGWRIDRSKKNGLTVSHGGSWVGFRTSIQRSVDRKLTVIVLSNNSTSKIDQILQAIDEL
jgi:CubicO group peptidase (beta-lactamase class C family)